MFRTPLALSALALVLALAPHPAAAQDLDAPRLHIGLGFHNADLPIGARWWLSDQYAVDLGLGFGTENGSTVIDTDNNGTLDTRVEETLGHWTIELGMPWTMKRWSKVAVLLRPAISYASEDDLESFLADGSRVKRNTFGATGELEVAWDIAHNLSISASHGLQYKSGKLDTPGATTDWSFDTTASDFTSLGFYVYLWGAK